MQLKDFTSDVLKALINVHRNNIIHCDIKPQNFLLFDISDSEENENEEILNTSNESSESYNPNLLLKLTDFGVCHPLSFEGSSLMKLSTGTHEYKAPEARNVKYLKRIHILLHL